MPFYQLLPTFLGRVSATKIDYRKEKIGYQLILTSLLEDTGMASHSLSWT